MSEEGMALRYAGSITAPDDTWVYMNMALSESYLGGVILCSFKCPDGGTGNTGNASYSYAQCFGRVYNATDGWVSGTNYRNNILRNYGAVDSFYTDSTAFLPIALMMNQNIVDDESYACTRIEYSIHPDGNMSITTNEPAISANDTATSGIGDLDNYTSVYDQIYKSHSNVHSSVTNTWLYIYAPGSTTWGMTNFGSGSTLHHYQWEKS